MTPTKQYVFRWKSLLLEVRPSKSSDENAVWEWAIKWLRPWNMVDGAEAEKFIREHGEVVEYVEG
jgi:hypothetical protein